MLHLAREIRFRQLFTCMILRMELRIVASVAATAVANKFRVRIDCSLSKQIAHATSESIQTTFNALIAGACRNTGHELTCVYPRCCSETYWVDGSINVARQP